MAAKTKNIKTKKTSSRVEKKQEKKEKPSGILSIKPRPAEERKELTDDEKKITLEVAEKDKIRRYEFVSEEEKEIYKEMMKKRKLYTPYFLLGIGINLLLYYFGLDLSRHMLWGFVVGVGIPMITMFGFAELHYRFIILPRENNG